MVFPIVHSSCGLGNTAGAVPSALCPSAPGLAEFGKAWTVPGTKVRPFSSCLWSSGLSVFMSLYTNVYSNQSVLKTHAGAGRGAAATLQAPQAQLRRARLGQARPLGPQHCACHRRPLSETRACPCRPGLRPPPLGPNTVPSQHLSELDLGPFCPLGLCQSVTRDWADPGTPQSTAQAVPDGSASAFQLPGHLVPCAGPCPEDTSCRNTPAQARGRVGVGVSLTNPQTFQTPLITDTCAQQ